MATPETEAPLDLPSFEVRCLMWGFDWNREATKKTPSGFVIKQNGAIRDMRKIAAYPATEKGWRQALKHAESLAGEFADAVRAQIRDESDNLATEAILKEISPVMTVHGAVYAGSYGYDLDLSVTKACDVYFTGTEVLVVRSGKRRVWARLAYADLYPLEFHAASPAVKIPGDFGGAHFQRDAIVESRTMLGIVGPDRGIFVEIAAQSPASTRIALMKPTHLIQGQQFHGQQRPGSGADSD